MRSVLRLATASPVSGLFRRWGLVPSFARLAPGERPDFYRMFNARDDGLVSKPVFSRLLPFRRWGLWGCRGHG